VINGKSTIYTGRVSCCALVTHVEYAPRALLGLGLGKIRDRQRDGRKPRRYIALTAGLRLTAL